MYIQYIDTYFESFFIYSLAEAASSSPLGYVRPCVSDKGTGDIVLTGARHPCLEKQDDMSFIANDVSLLRGTCT